MNTVNFLKYVPDESLEQIRKNAEDEIREANMVIAYIDGRLRLKTKKQSHEINVSETEKSEPRKRIRRATNEEMKNAVEEVLQKYPNGLKFSVLFSKCLAVCPHYPINGNAQFSSMVWNLEKRENRNIRYDAMQRLYFPKVKVEAVVQ